MELNVGRVRVGEIMVAMMAVISVFLAPSFITTNAYDPSPLQNICVADYDSRVHVNGYVCKDPKLVTVDDFVFSGLQIPTDTNNTLGSGSKRVTVNELPGLNTLGMSLLRIDLAVNGVATPHVHHRSTEIIVVLKGTIFAGFIDSTPGTKSRLFAKILKPGDVFVFPIGLIHFDRNVGNTSATVLAAFNSQEMGFIRVVNDVFGSDPHIPSELLAKSYQLYNKEVERLQSLPWDFSF